MYYTFYNETHKTFILYIFWSRVLLRVLRQTYKKIQIMNCQQVTQKITGAYLMTRARAFSYFSMEISFLYFCYVSNEMRRVCEYWLRFVVLVI